jgi:hypothetical protein
MTIKPSELAIKIYEYKEANPHLSFYDVCANFNLISSIGMTLYGKAKVYFDKLKGFENKNEPIVYASHCGNAIIRSGNQQFNYYLNGKLAMSSKCLNEVKELAEMDVRYKLKKVKGHYYG